MIQSKTQTFIAKHLPGEHCDSPKLTEILGPPPTGGGECPVLAQIQWQDGSIGEHGVNGVQLEEVVGVCIERLQALQDGAFPCAENTYAIDHLRSAVDWQAKRKAARVAQGVEGQRKPHAPAGGMATL